MQEDGPANVHQEEDEVVAVPNSTVHQEDASGVEENDLVGEQSRKTLPKNLIARTPEQVSRCRASGSGGKE